MALLQGKVGIITASGSGIGRTSALVCAEEGAKIVVSDVVDEAGEETVRLIKEAGGDAIYIRCNVADAADVKNLVDKTMKHFGRLDFAHNNAGIGAPNVPLAEVEVEDYQRVMSITLEGTFLCMKYEIPAMLKSGGGSIVNTSSSSGLVGTPLQSAYSAAKFGVNGLMKTAALEYGSQGIRVNSICPGMTMTPAVEKWMKEAPEEAEALKNNVPMQRLGTTEDQANAVAWLCSDKASYVNGVTLSVDGGLLAQ
ncbi:MAG TPA: glucose 1-dehydrogenase [Pseudogracilibacillus sp.]|nr:glucose 1-dehydrogenase [Pseudogracilibacillus sp.]